MSDPKYVKIRYAEVGETGWAEELEDGTYRIANVPLEPSLNLGDIVTVKTQEGSGWRVVDKILKRAYAFKTTIWYDTVDQFKALAPKLQEQGGQVEGGVPPKDGRRGFFIVAYNRGLQPHHVAVEVGIKDPDKPKP